MSAPAGHDLTGLIKRTARDDWRGRVDAVMAEHFEPALEASDLTFEDFLTRRSGPEGKNVMEPTCGVAAGTSAPPYTDKNQA